MGASTLIVRIRLTAIFITLNKDDYIDKIPNKVKLLACQLASLLKGKIEKIFINKFQLMNLYKLRHIRGYNIITYTKIKYLSKKEY